MNARDSGVQQHTHGSMVFRKPVGPSKTRETTSGSSIRDWVRMSTDPMLLLVFVGPLSNFF